MEAQSCPTSGLRDLTRRTVAAQIAERAKQLFIEQGFEETTLEHIAAAVGISSRSVSRYFKTKEDIVVGSMIALGDEVAAALRERPLDEAPWTALRRALDVSVNSITNDSAGLRAARMRTDTPALRAAVQEKHRAWTVLLVPDLVERLGQDIHDGEDAVRIGAEAMVVSALACLDVAVEAWARTGNDLPLGFYLDTTFNALRS
ncbi:TetR/AcrR family transcriptional regulator [Mycolicibacterium sp.]|uniref:TetR/AcrR family transcriptional regulator n=1 Tax=Mycolicibacterium sp. TaxID=2320850 RepID=UPI001A2E07FC|nr:TetR/AcrR family transcriptional regulator [Mycolicibacterium sp.]MBJ7337584.1 TetR family transcriptional regulator [Mycolicibacterium sp.]